MLNFSILPLLVLISQLPVEQFGSISGDASDFFSCQIVMCNSRFVFINCLIELKFCEVSRKIFFKESLNVSAFHPERQKSFIPKSKTF